MTPTDTGAEPKNKESKDGKPRVEPKAEKAGVLEPETTASRRGCDRGQDKPKVQILNTSWNQSLPIDFTEVSCKIKNLSAFALKGLKVTICYKDQNGEVIHSKDWSVGDVAVDEEKTFVMPYGRDSIYRGLSRRLTATGKDIGCGPPVRPSHELISH